MRRNILCLLFLISVLFAVKVEAGSPPSPVVKKWWTFSKDKGLVGDSTDENTKFAAFLTAAGLTKEGILDDGKIYRVTDSIIIPESTKLFLNGATIILDIDSAEQGIMMPYSGSKIYGPGQIINLNKWAKPVGASGSCIYVGRWPNVNPVSPTDGVEIRGVTVRTRVKDAFGIVALGLVRNPVFDQITLDATSTDSCAGLIAAEWAYGYDSTYTYHPQNVTISNFICDSVYNGPASTNPVYLSGVDGFKVSNGIVAYSGNNGFSVVAGEEGFAKADPAYHRVADSLYSSGGIVENVQLRSVARSGFVITGKPSAADVRYYPRLTYINCTVDTSAATTYHAGFLIAYSNGVTLQNCRVAKNITGAKVEVGARNVTFDNCYFFKNRSSGIYIGDTTTVSTDMPYGINITHSLFENNGTSDHAAAVTVGKATEVNVGPANTFGLESGESQTYAVRDSASGTMRIFSNTVRGYYSGGAGFYLSDSCSVHDNEVYSGLTKYAGSAGAGLDVGEGRIPFTIGAAGSVLGVLAGDTLGYFTPAGTGTVTDAILGDTLNSYMDSAAVVDTIQGLMGTYATSAEIRDTVAVITDWSMNGDSAYTNQKTIAFDVDGGSDDIYLWFGYPNYIEWINATNRFFFSDKLQLNKGFYAFAGNNLFGANSKPFWCDTAVDDSALTVTAGQMAKIAADTSTWRLAANGFRGAGDTVYTAKSTISINNDVSDGTGDAIIKFSGNKMLWWDNATFSRFRIGGPARVEVNFVVDNKTLFIGLPYYKDTTVADSQLITKHYADNVVISSHSHEELKSTNANDTLFGISSTDTLKFRDSSGTWIIQGADGMTYYDSLSGKFVYADSVQVNASNYVRFGDSKLTKALLDSIIARQVGSGDTLIVVVSATEYSTINNRIKLAAGANITFTRTSVGGGAYDSIEIAATGGSGTGDIEGVEAGVAISGGGTAGTVTINVDTTTLKTYMTNSYFGLADFDNSTLDTTAAGKLEVKTDGINWVQIAGGGVTNNELASGTIQPTKINYNYNFWAKNWYTGTSAADTLVADSMLVNQKQMQDSLTGRADDYAAAAHGHALSDSLALLSKLGPFIDTTQTDTIEYAHKAVLADSSNGGAARSELADSCGGGAARSELADSSAKTGPITWTHVWPHFSTTYFDTLNVTGDTNIIVILSDSANGGAARAELADSTGGGAARAELADSCGGGAARAEIADAVTDADKGDVTISSGAWAVEDNSHNHDSTSLSAISVSKDINAFASADLAGICTNETGSSGVLVFSAGATLTGKTTVDSIVADTVRTSALQVGTDIIYDITGSGLKMVTTSLSADTGTQNNDGLATKDFVRDSGGGVSNAAVSDSAITLLNATAWRMFYSNGTATAIQELALGASGTYLKANGTSSAPTWATPTATVDTSDADLQAMVDAHILETGFDANGLAITNLTVNGGMRLNGMFAKQNMRTAWDIDNIVPVVPDTFFTTLCSKGLPTGVGDSSRHVHPGVVYFPEGWPLGSDSVLAWKYWMVSTPLQVNMTDSIENPHLHVTNDIADFDSWTDQWGAGAEDTFINPIDTATLASTTHRIDTFYVYYSEDDTTYYDTSGAGVDDTILWANLSSMHISDPGLIQTADGGVLLYYRVTYHRSVEGWRDMSVIFAKKSTNGVDWGATSQITRMGRWLSPAIVLDTGSTYVMYCSAQDDPISGIRDTTVLYRFTSKFTYSMFNYEGPCTMSGLPTGSKLWHQSAWAPAYDQQLMMFNFDSAGVFKLRLGESSDHGANWRISTRDVVKGLPSANDGDRWWQEVYQSSFFGIDRGSHLSLGIAYSGKRDTANGTSSIWHMGYIELPLNAHPWASEIVPGQIYGNMRTSDSVRATFPYATGTDFVTFMDTAIVAGAVDSVFALYTFEGNTQVDSLTFYYKSSVSVVESISVYIPTRETGSVFADSVGGMSSGTDVAASGTWAQKALPINYRFGAGQEMGIKWFIDHDNAGDFIQVKRIMLHGRRCYD
jgi:hypothetical protein